jgi:hypothetical protein
MNTPLLHEQSGVDDPDKVVGRLATKYNKKFAPAINRPRNRAGGGFYIRIRETSDATKERLDEYGKGKDLLEMSRPLNAP